MCGEAFKGFGTVCAKCRQQAKLSAGSSPAPPEVLEFAVPGDFDGVQAELFVDPSQSRRIRVGIHNARTMKGVDMHARGFELLQLPTALERDAFLSEARIEGAYYGELCAAVRARLCASRVVCFSHKTRLSAVQDFANGLSGYVSHVHADYSPQLAWKTVARVLEEQSMPPVSAGCRYVLANVWRNVSDTSPILNNPLALCDASSDGECCPRGVLARTPTHRRGYEA